MTEIGVYVSAGSFSGTYKLRDDYETSKGAGKDAEAPKVEEDNSSDAEMDNVEMEDVFPGIA